MDLRRTAWMVVGLGLVAVGLAIDAVFDFPIELAGEIIASAGGFCLALAVISRPRF